MKYNEVLNKEYIMKAVHHCVDGAGCPDCPYEFAPDCASIEELLCYIKELTEENERLRFISAHICVGDVITSEQIEKQRMAHTLPGMHRDPVGPVGMVWVESYDEVRAETVRKMQERFKERLDISVCGYSTEEVVGDVLETLDRVAKEMLEENNV